MSAVRRRFRLFTELIRKHKILHAYHAATVTHISPRLSEIHRVQPEIFIDHFRTQIMIAVQQIRIAGGHKGCRHTGAVVRRIRILRLIIRTSDRSARRTEINALAVIAELGIGITVLRHQRVITASLRRYRRHRNHTADIGGIGIHHIPSVIAGCGDTGNSCLTEHIRALLKQQGKPFSRHAHIHNIRAHLRSVEHGAVDLKRTAVSLAVKHLERQDLHILSGTACDNPGTQGSVHVIVGSITDIRDKGASARSNPSAEQAVLRADARIKHCNTERILRVVFRIKPLRECIAADRLIAPFAGFDRIKRFLVRHIPADMTDHLRLRKQNAVIRTERTARGIGIRSGRILQHMQPVHAGCGISAAVQIKGAVRPDDQRAGLIRRADNGLSVFRQIGTADFSGGLGKRNSPCCIGAAVQLRLCHRRGLLNRQRSFGGRKSAAALSGRAAVPQKLPGSAVKAKLRKRLLRHIFTAGEQLRHERGDSRPLCCPARNRRGDSRAVQ